LPDPAEQVFFIRDPAATLNQRQKRVIDLRREGDNFASSEEKALVPVKPVRSKFQALTGLGSHIDFRILSEFLPNLRRTFAVVTP
jgi:hypothetical protein